MRKRGSETGRRLTLLAPWPPPYGGVAVHAQRLRELLADQGVQSDVLTFNQQSATVGVHRFSFGRSWWPTHLASLARVAGWRGVLHNHYSSLTMYSLAREDPETRRLIESLLWFSKLWQITWVETVHDQTIVDRFPNASPETRALFLRAMTAAARIIAIGDPMRAFLVASGVKQDKIVVSGPLLPARPKVESPPLRYRPFFATHAPVWISIGAFIPLYDFATIARAFRRFLTSEPNAGLILISGSFASDHGYRREVLAELSDLKSGVLLLEDIENSEVISLLQASALFVRGAEHESFGLSRAEAILAGTPVVATNTGVTDFLTLYAYGNVESLASAATDAIDCPLSDEAVHHYETIANLSLDVVLSVYRDLGITGDPAERSA